MWTIALPWRKDLKVLFLTEISDFARLGVQVKHHEEKNREEGACYRKQKENGKIRYNGKKSVKSVLLDISKEECLVHAVYCLSNLNNGHYA
jgi:hypothetical protein